MPDYLQDLLDRFSAYSDPSQYPAPVFDPTATDEENKKKKKPPDVAAPATPLPPWAQQAGVLAAQAGPDTSVPPLMRLLANPANPAYGVNPMSSQLSQTAAADAAAKAAQVNQPPPAWAQQPGNLTYGINGVPAARDFPTPPAPPSEENPSPVAAGTTPLPRERPAGAPQREPSGDTSATPPRSTVMQTGNQPSVIQQTGQQAGMLPAGAPSPLSLGDIGNKIMSGLGAHSNLLLAMGAGLMGAPNVWQGLGRGFSYAGPAAQQDIKQQQMLGQQQAVYNALVGAGAPANMARAATLDPDIKRQMLQSYIADKGYEIKPVETTNFFGGKDTRYIAVNKFNPADSFDIQTGQRLGSGGPAGQAGVTGAPGAPAGTAGAPAPSGANSIFFAPGVTEQTLDQSKTGDDYLAQFSPMVQQSVKDYLHGTFDPRGNRQLGQAVTFIGQKYGHDIGMEADPAKINQRRTYEMQLASPKSGVGQKKWGFQQGLEHFADITDNMVKMHLSNGYSGPLGEKAANYINWYKSLTPDQQELIRYNKGMSMSLARELGNMAGGGGVHEAKERSEALGGGFGSGKAAAGAVEQVRDLMDGSLRTMENERDELFPDERYRPQGANFKSPRQQELLDRIDRNIAILKGQTPRPKEAPAATAAAATTAPKPKGTYDYDPATGGFIQRQ